MLEEIDGSSVILYFPTISKIVDVLPVIVVTLPQVICAVDANSSSQMSSTCVGGAETLSGVISSNSWPCAELTCVRRSACHTVSQAPSKARVPQTSPHRYTR